MTTYDPQTFELAGSVWQARHRTPDNAGIDANRAHGTFSTMGREAG